MTIQEALKTYREKIFAMQALGHAMGVLHYDGATVAPVESAEGRGKTLGYLSGCAYEIETGKELSEAAKYLNEHKEELKPLDRREIQLFLRQSEYTASISSFVMPLSSLIVAPSRNFFDACSISACVICAMVGPFF